MLDYKYIKDNLEAVKQNIKNRNMTADADLVVELYDKRTALITEKQNLQQKRNANADSMKGKMDAGDREKLIAEGKAVKEEIANVDKELAEYEVKLDEAARKIPNMCNPEVPIGKLDTENLEVKKVGVPRKFAFTPKDHVQLGEELDLIDFDRGTKVSGPKFYYLKNEAVFLEQALIMYALNILRKHNFTPFITPDVAREEILQGIGFNPRGKESNVYTLASLQQPKLRSAATIQVKFLINQNSRSSTADFHTVSAAKQDQQDSSAKDCTASTSLTR